MSQKTYTDLIEAFAAEIGLDAQPLLKTQEVVIDGLAIGLAYEGNDDFADFVYFVDLGAAPEHRQHEVHERLLQANCLWAGTGGATLGLQPDTGHVILASRLELEGMTAESLAALLDVFVDTAAFWKSYLADGAAEPMLQTPPFAALRG